MSAQFTPKQLADWKKYERVRQSGRHNMFTPEARRATGMGKEDYIFVLHNYSALKEAALSLAGQQGQKT